MKRPLTLPFIVTGTGRCGTMVTSGVLRNLDIRVTHEGNRKEPMPNDVCCFVAPYLKRDNGYKIYHLVREPLMTIASLARHITPGNPSLKIFMKGLKDGGVECEEIPCGIGWASWFVLNWNLMIEKVADARFRIEDGDLYTHITGCGAQEIRLAHNGASINSLPRIEVAWDDVPERLRPQLQELAVRYGYEVP